MTNKTIFSYLLTIIKRIKSEVKGNDDIKLSVPQFMALQTVNRHNGKISNKEIAEKFNITNASASSMIKKLETAGYLQTKKSQTDKRSQVIFLSKYGVEVLEETKKILALTGEKIFAKLTKQEYQQLKTLLQKVCSS